MDVGEWDAKIVPHEKESGWGEEAVSGWGFVLVSLPFFPISIFSL